MAARLQGSRRGVLGTDCGSTLPARLRQAGPEVVSRKGWLVERWAPRFTRDYVRDLLAYFASVAPGYALPDADQAYWRELKQRPDRLLDDRCPGGCAMPRANSLPRSRPSQAAFASHPLKWPAFDRISLQPVNAAMRQ
ncbi:hypothetical protein NKI51_09595 [Mesorhizobium australicum]|uniref:hypothetical protein n=1 Tax=Mesorhizobium TaxID=68287 RepID=UPI0003CEC700|nr:MULTISPECIES: hypothetical protein [unclassified Mesorhizobium]ESY91548.1 hypothetical protein X741_23205 [Mesorhizobium sp. LNHC229A00]ESZ00106.1 hypothetical protein X738_12020 [Mesorhizobium sp. LNHC209A00]